MEEDIELTFESPDGIIDCRLEAQRTEAGLVFSATILYPNVINGYSKSEIYCCDLQRDDRTGTYSFVYGDEGIPPRIQKLEAQIAAALKGQR